jgi:hypothetical protein
MIALCGFKRDISNVPFFRSIARALWEKVIRDMLHVGLHSRGMERLVMTKSVKIFGILFKMRL